MILLHLIQHATALAPVLQHVLVDPQHFLVQLDGGNGAALVAQGSPPAQPKSTGNAYNDIYGFVNSLQQFAHALGLAVFLLCETVAGIMYMVSLGNDRNRALAIGAITSAVVGLVFMLLAVAISNLLTSGFGG